jgi:ADP-ribose pyrophosphatase YjhB (NUDIX family)
MSECFAFCPSCGTEGIAFSLNKRYLCSRCGFEYFHNVATAAGVFIVSKGRLLCLERAQEPGKGLLALPGGFVDPGERAEDAVKRECREEVGFKLGDISFLCTFPNEYRFRGMLYHTCDLYFFAQDDRVELADLAVEPGEVTALSLVPLSKVNPSLFAFPAARKAWMLFTQTPAFNQMAHYSHVV